MGFCGKESVILSTNNQQSDPKVLNECREMSNFAEQLANTTLMITFPNAKINLGLNIVARRHDGYHDISTLFYPVDIKDALEIVPAKGDATTLSLSGNAVDCPVEKNLVMKAFRLMQSMFDLPEVDIHLHKAIPDGAGLGGGSADASATLLMLNAMYSLGLADERLAELAASLGADCPFFIYNRPMLASGIGDVFSPVSIDLSSKWLVLVKPDVYVSTKEAYAGVVPAQPAVPIADIVMRDVPLWRGVLLNDFERSVFARFGQLAQIKEQLYGLGAEYASMSGSGSSMFGIFDSANMAESAFRSLDFARKFVVRLAPNVR